MAQQSRYEGSNLVWLTAAIMIAVTLYEGGSTVSKAKGSARINKTADQVFPQLLAIAGVTIVMSIMIDQVPEFGKPFALLVLVAFLTIKTPVIKTYFHQTQGTTK